MSEYIKNEKAIQERIKNHIERLIGHPIKDETCFHFRKENKEDHSYILKDDFINAIKRLNPAIFNRKDLKNTESEIAEQIWNNFKNKYDSCETDKIYDLFFNSIHKINLTFKNNNSLTVRYFILDKGILTNECSNNQITIIREKALFSHYGVEYPDFALYCNGLPFLIVEVKNPILTNPLIAGYADYRTKRTYHKFLGCILTDGKKMSLVVSPNINSNNFDVWRNYGDNKTNDNGNGLNDFIDEFFNNPKNLMMLFMFGIFRTNSGNLACHRVQQYFVTKKIIAKMSQNRHTNIPFRSLIKHPPRSGKTITSRSVVHVVTELFIDRFDKIFIQLPDITITNQFLKDFKKFVFGNDIPVKEIECRAKNDKGKFSYEEAVTTNARGIYIMNMQKSEETYFIDTKNMSNKVLFILDEVHTHQAAEMAEHRSKQFPNASYITFTATPRVKNGCDISQSKYADDGEGYLDELTNESAMGLDIVLPIQYKKAGYEIFQDISKLTDYADNLKEELRRLIERHPQETARLERISNQRLENDFGVLIHEINLYSNTIQEIRNTYDDKIEEEVLRNIPISINSFFNAISREYIDYRIDFIIHFMKNNPYNFKAKAFWVVDSKIDAMLIMDWILKNTGSNNYGGLKFGADFSCNNDEFNILKDFNCVDKQEDIIKLFSEDNEDSIDVLILVAKYLKGYDNKQLSYVFCDTIIQEPTKMYQLYTRPGTKRDFKKIGFFVDMCPFDTNYKTFESAVQYYEKHENIFSIILTDEKISKIKNNIYNNGILVIADICGYLDINQFRVDLRENPDMFAELDIELQADIHETCMLINDYCRQLVCFEKYGPDIFLDVLMIGRAFLKMKNYDYNSKRRFFSKEQHMEIAREIMDRLGYDSIRELMSVELNGNIYERHVNLESGPADFLSKEISINFHGKPNTYNCNHNFIDGVLQKANNIDSANWGEQNDINKSLTEWYKTIQYIQILPDLESNIADWEKIYHFIETMVNKNIKHGHIVPGENIDANILDKIRHQLLLDIDDNNLIKYENIFDDENESNARNIIKLSIGYVIGIL